MNKLRLAFYGFVAAVATSPVVLAVGTADTEVATGVTNAEATWALVKTAIIAIVVAVLGIRFLRRLK